MAILNKNNSEIKDSKISSKDLVDLLSKLEEGSLSGPGAKKIIELCWSSNESVDVLIKKEGFDEVKGEDELLEIITKILRDNPKQFEQYLNGKDKLFGFFVGQVMKETKGNADPKLVNELLNKKLKQ